jgi:hypothetical protein
VSERRRTGADDAEDLFSFMVELLGWPTLLLENTMFLLD